MSNGLDCPVDFVTINENRARLVAFFILLLSATCFLTANWIIAAFLLIDFGTRVFNLYKYSLLAIVAGLLIKLFNIKNKLVDRAPKRFAALIGLIFSTAILATLLLDFIMTAKILLDILMIFAALESLAGFCAGCHVYTWLKRFRLIN
jgi:hypothetical protein